MPVLFISFFTFSSGYETINVALILHVVLFHMIAPAPRK